MSTGSWGAILPFTESLHTDPIWRRCVAQPSRLPECITLLWRVIKAPVSLSKYYTLPECSRLWNSALTVTSTLPWAGLIQHLGHTEADEMALWIKICYTNFLVRKSPLPFASQLKHYSMISHCGWTCTQSSFPRRQIDLHKISGAGKGAAFRCFRFLWHHKAAEDEILLLTWRTLFLALSYLHSVCHKMTILVICWIKH